jgi:MFS family permease
VADAPAEPALLPEGGPDERRWVPILLVFTVLIATSVFGARPLITYVALDLGAGPAEIGLIASSFAVLAIVGAIPLGRLIDRVGERPIMLAGGLICAVTNLAVIAMDSLLFLAVATAFLGVGQMFAVVGSHTLLANRGPASKQAMRIGWYTSAASLGHAIGPLTVGFIIGESLTRESTVVALLGAAGAALIATVVVIGIARRPRPLHARGETAIKRSSVRSTLRRPGMIPALTAGIIALIAVDLLVAYLPAYGEERGISPQTIGILLGTIALAQMVSRLFLGRLLARFSHATVVIGSVLIAGFVIPLLIPAFGVPVLLAVMTVAGLALGLAQPMTLVWVAIATPPENRGMAMGVRMSGNRLGQLLVPVAVGATAGQFGVSAIFATIAGMLVAAAGYVFTERDTLVAATASAAARGPSVPVPITTLAEPEAES